MKLRVTAVALGQFALAGTPAWAAEPRPGTYSVTTEITATGMPVPQKSTEEICLTEEDVRELTGIVLGTAFTEEDDDCRIDNTKRVGDRLSFDRVCDEVGGKSVTKADLTFGGDWYRVSSTTQIDGEVIGVKQDARWLRSGCAKQDRD